MGHVIKHLTLQSNKTPYGHIVRQKKRKLDLHNNDELTFSLVVENCCSPILGHSDIAKPRKILQNMNLHCSDIVTDQNCLHGIR